MKRMLYRPMGTKTHTNRGISEPTQSPITEPINNLVDIDLNKITRFPYGLEPQRLKKTEKTHKSLNSKKMGKKNLLVSPSAPCNNQLGKKHTT